MNIKYLNKLHKLDARDIDKLILDKAIDVTITSPPYFNLKDYGYKNQIGYGQTYDNYLKDLKKVFKSICDITKSQGSLWVVIDTFRKDNQIVPLPFDFSNMITGEDVGWKLQDIIIWHKNKTVPWSKKGQTKKIFEYILHFSKSHDFKYFADRVREHNPQQLKEWWVRYPERYNPKGKSPEEIWNYDIPLQGSWGNSYIRHFCPLPTDMIGRMIRLSTNKGDLVLDPFAGSGSVLFQAGCMGRNFIGVEMNDTYIDMFNKYYEENYPEALNQYEMFETLKSSQKHFEKLILNLRALKFAKVLRLHTNRQFENVIGRIYVEILKTKPKDKYKLINVKYQLFIDQMNELSNQYRINDIDRYIRELLSKPPLSKFGIKPDIQYCSNSNEMSYINCRNKLFIYDNNATHKYSRIYKKGLVLGKLSIISPIKVCVDEKEYQ